MEANIYEKVVELARRRGFFWTAYEIYGGVGGFYALGDLGVKLRDRIVELWKQLFVKGHGFLLVDTPSIGPHSVFKASGHVDNFKDPMAECGVCGRKYRADHLLRDSGIRVSEGASTEEMEGLLNGNGVRCPECGSSRWRVRMFPTMFETRIGPYSESTGFLRPETAQGMFVEFRRIYETARERMPLGVAQIGRGFRNEISPRQTMVRLREFNMMELEVFTNPEEGCRYLAGLENEELALVTEDMAKRGEHAPLTIGVHDALSQGLIKNEWLAYFMVLSKRFLRLLGVHHDKQRFWGKPPEERAHYSQQTFDHEVLIPGLGWVEVAGLAYRTDYDLRAHSKASGKDLHVSMRTAEPKTEKMMRWRIKDMMELKEILGDKLKEFMELFEEHKDDERFPELIGSRLGIDVDELPLEAEEKVETVHVKRFYPHVIEPSYGLERLMLATLSWAYGIREGNRIVLSLPPYVAPIQVAVFPLITRDGLPEKAKEVVRKLSERFDVLYDEGGSIGRRYARVDEIGVPYAVTVDHRTLEDNTVTLRSRDDWSQIRVELGELEDELEELLSLPNLETTR